MAKKKPDAPAPPPPPPPATISIEGVARTYTSVEGVITFMPLSIPRNVRLAINGTVVDTTLPDEDGLFQFENVDNTAGNCFLVYFVDAEGQGATVAKMNASNTVPLFVTENCLSFFTQADPVTNADVAIALNSEVSPGVITGASGGILTLAAGKALVVDVGTYAPGGPTLVGADFIVNIRGSFDRGSEESTVTLNLEANAAIQSGGGSFDELVFDGSFVTLYMVDDLTCTSLTIPNDGVLDLGVGTLTIKGGILKAE